MRSMSVGALVLLMACTRPNPLICCRDEVDCTEQGISPDHMCGPGLICRGNQCISEPCTSSADCDAAAPYCVAELCAEMCTEDVQCPGYGQDLVNRFCVVGAWVECRDAADCPVDAPTCAMGSCQGCRADSECASNVCDVDSFTCIDESRVAYVSPTGSTTSDCTRAAPCTLPRAVQITDATRNVIKLDPNGNHQANDDITGTKAVTIYGPGTIVGSVGAHDGGTLRLRDLTVNGYTSCVNLTVNLAMPSLELRRVVYVGPGIQAIPCFVAIEQSSLKSTITTYAATLLNVGGEVAGQGGATANRGSVVTLHRSVLEGGDPGITLYRYGRVEITNSIFKNQGTTYGSIQFNQWADNASTVRFTTFFNSTLTCAGGSGFGFLTSANNVYFNARGTAPADTVSGTYCSHSYDLVKPQSTTLPGPGNVIGVDPKLANWPSGDFHLMSGSPAIDVADPNATESVDYDGLPRPVGSARDIGAFEYHP